MRLLLITLVNIISGKEAMKNWTLQGTRKEKENRKKIIWIQRQIWRKVTTTHQSQGIENHHR